MRCEAADAARWKAAPQEEETRHTRKLTVNCIELTSFGLDKTINGRAKATRNLARFQIESRSLARSQFLTYFLPFLLPRSVGRSSRVASKLLPVAAAH